MEQENNATRVPETGLSDKPVEGGFTPRYVAPVRLYVLLLVAGLCSLGDMLILKWLWEIASVFLLAAYMAANVAIAMSLLKRMRYW